MDIELNMWFKLLYITPPPLLPYNQNQHLYFPRESITKPNSSQEALQDHWVPPICLASSVLVWLFHGASQYMGSLWIGSFHRMLNVEVSHKSSVMVPEKNMTLTSTMLMTSSCIYLLMTPNKSAQVVGQKILYTLTFKKWIQYQYKHCNRNWFMIPARRACAAQPQNFQWILLLSSWISWWAWLYLTGV